MASVSLTLSLKEEMIQNYRKQVQTAYESKYDVGAAIDTICATLQNGGNGQFTELCNAATRYTELADKFHQDLINMTAPLNSPSQGRYSQTTHETATQIFLKTSSWYHHGQTPPPQCQSDLMPIRMQELMVFVVNDKRPIEDNLQLIADWTPGYTNKWEASEVEASDNHVDGDLCYVHEFATPVYLPIKTAGQMKSHDAAEDYAPVVKLGLMVSEPSLVNALKQIPETDKKIREAVDKYSDFLLQFNTLKQYLDGYPEGRSLVPQWAMEKMAAPAAKPKPKTNKQVEAKDLMPEDLRDEMNNVILENKLLGDS